MSLEYINLTLDLQDGQGNAPTQGVAIFVLSAELLDTIDHADITMAPITANFNAGVPIVKLLANDSPNLTPGSAWTVTFQGVPGNPGSRTFVLSAANGTDQYYSSQGSASPVAEMASYLQGAYPGPVNEYLNGAGQWVTLPAAPAAPVSSVNGHTGAVALTSADVGADPAGTATTAIAGLLVDKATATPGVYQMVDGSYYVVPQASLGTANADDALAIGAAFALLPTQTDPDNALSVQVGTVRLSPGIFNIKTQLTKPASANFTGSGPGTFLNVYGSIMGVYTHHAKPPVNGTQHNSKSGTISHMVINGVNAGANAIGLDVGDGWGHNLEHLWIENFTGAGAIGLSVCNRTFYTEKCRGHHVSLINNATAVKHWTVTSDQSHEYNDFEYFIYASSDQNGILIQGVNYNGSLKMRGNFLKGLGANSILTLVTDPGGAGDAFLRGHVDLTCEQNPGTSGTSSSASITFGDANQKLYASGYMRFEAGSTNAVAGNLQFRGAVWMGNNTVQLINASPALPATGVAYTNNQNDAAVYFHGGTVTSILINGIITGITSGMVYVPSAGTVTVNYTVAPTWKWVSAL